MHWKALFIISSTCLLAACAPAAEASPTSGEPIAPTSTPEPTATSAPVVVVPESLASQEDLLRLAGYFINETVSSVELVNREGESVLQSTEAATITITTKDGETLIYPQEAFDVRETIGAGVEQILTVKDPSGEVEYFLLNKTGEWVKPLEIQTNPREIENYPEIDIEDVWNGRALYSELLEAEPFPEGTIVPDSFAYLLRRNPISYYVELRDFEEGALDSQPVFHTEIVNQDNDYRRWTNFYRTQTPDGVDALIGTEQVLSTDGKTSIFFHYIFGPEWPWPEDYIFPSGNRWNVIDDVFLGKTIQYDHNIDHRLGTIVRPVISVAYKDPDHENEGVTILPGNAPAAAGASLYASFEENNPTTTRGDLPQLIQDRYEEVLSSLDYVAEAGSELEKLQYMALMAKNIQVVRPEYFESSR